MRRRSRKLSSDSDSDSEDNMFVQVERKCRRWHAMDSKARKQARVRRKCARDDAQANAVGERKYLKV